MRPSRCAAVGTPCVAAMAPLGPSAATRPLVCDQPHDQPHDRRPDRLARISSGAMRGAGGERDDLARPGRGHPNPLRRRRPATLRRRRRRASPRRRGARARRAGSRADGADDERRERAAGRDRGPRPPRDGHDAAHRAGRRRRPGSAAAPVRAGRRSGGGGGGTAGSRSPGPVRTSSPGGSSSRRRLGYATTTSAVEAWGHHPLAGRRCCRSGRRPVTCAAPEPRAAGARSPPVGAGCAERVRRRPRFARWPSSWWPACSAAWRWPPRSSRRGRAACGRRWSRSSWWRWGCCWPRARRRPGCSG